MKNYKIKELALRKSFKLVTLVVSGPGIKELDPTTHTFYSRQPVSCIPEDSHPQVELAAYLVGGKISYSPLL